MKTLLLDIETTPALVYTWGLFEQTITVDQIVEPTSVLCWAAKWHGSDKIMWCGSRNGDRSFEVMIQRIHSLLSEADAVCHYNGKSFDIPRLNQEFLKLDMSPPPPIPQIDLKLVINKQFSMLSTKLAFVGPYLEIGEKVKHEGWDLWRGCIDGNKESWKTMRKYNEQDVVLLERLYEKLLPWIDQHPNLNLMTDEKEPRCPNCGSTKLHRRGVARATTYEYARFQCQECGRWCRARRSVKRANTVEVR